MKILLHVCCAPCMIFPLRVLRDEGHDVHAFFYNPNIHPYMEYKKRLDTLKGYAVQAGIDVISDGSYPFENFLRLVVFRENDRCRYCYQIRLTEVVRKAVELDFDAFTTTLLYSRYQKHDLIRQISEELSRNSGISFFYRDFREGWAEGVRLSKEMGMYRQPYCGCIYSEKERYYRNPDPLKPEPKI